MQLDGLDAILASLLVLSEGLGTSSKVRAKSIIGLLGGVLKGLFEKAK